jgi:hypothetical protein
MAKRKSFYLYYVRVAKSLMIRFLTGYVKSKIDESKQG